MFFKDDGVMHCVVGSDCRNDRCGIGHTENNRRVRGAKQVLMRAEETDDRSSARGPSGATI